MKHKKIMSFILAAMLSSAVPTMTSAEGGEVNGSEIIDKNMETEDVTFTEYNDKENKMYSVVGRNRLDARTDSAIPYQDEQTALKSAVNYAKETSNRVKMLTGKGASNQWDMTVVKNLAMGAERGLINADGTTNAFAAKDFVQDDTWKKNVSMPSSWTSYGEWWNNKNTPNGENETWVWDYPIYDNVKMPWQSGEQPQGTGKSDMYGTLEPGEAPVAYNPIGF